MQDCPRYSNASSKGDIPVRRIPLAAVLLALLFSMSACKSVPDVTECLSLPFSSAVKLNIESSEYMLRVEKGAGNLVSVAVTQPEALSGLTAVLGENSAVAFDGMQCESALPQTAAELIYAVFCDEKRVSVTPGGDVTEVSFASRFGGGKLTLDSFSAVPLSLEADGVYMEFSEFKR